VGLLGILAAVSLGAPLLRLLYGSEFALQSSLLVGLMVVASIQHVQTILQYAMTAARYLRIQPAVFSVAALLHAALCVSLIPSQGLGGAVLALGTVYAFEILASLGVIAYSLGDVRRRTEKGAVAEI
jgi:O-antigen/teichoic acid export membrane protein